MGLILGLNILDVILFFTHAAKTVQSMITVRNVVKEEKPEIEVCLKVKIINNK